METFDFDWQSTDNLKIYGKCWLPSAIQPRAMVCAVHGFAEHIGRYEQVAQYMNQQGYGFIGFDQRGHGKSEGQRGHTPDYEALLINVSEFLALVKEKFNGLPLFLYGHSMGGNMFVEIAKAGLFALTHAKEFNLPLLLMHGTGDNITSYQATQEFATQVPANWLTFQLWEAMKHELHNEIVKDQVLSTMSSWIEDRLSVS